MTQAKHSPPPPATLPQENSGPYLWLAGCDALDLLLGYPELGPGARGGRLEIALPQLVLA